MSASSDMQLFLRHDQNWTLALRDPIARVIDFIKRKSGIGKGSRSVELPHFILCSIRITVVVLE